MKNTFSILFYLRTSKKKKNGTTPIYVRVTVNGKRSDFSAKRSIDVLKWNKSKARAKGTNEVTRILNIYLDTIQSQIYEHHQQLIRRGKFVSAVAIKNSYLGLTEEKKTLLDLFQYHINCLQFTLIALLL